MELKVTFVYFGWAGTGWSRLSIMDKVLFLLIKFLDYGIIIIVNERGGFTAHREADITSPARSHLLGQDR